MPYPILHDFELGCDLPDKRRYRGAAEPPKPIVAQLIVIKEKRRNGARAHDQSGGGGLDVARTVILDGGRGHVRKTAFLNLSQLVPLFSQSIGHIIWGALYLNQS